MIINKNYPEGTEAQKESLKVDFPNLINQRRRSFVSDKEYNVSLLDGSGYLDFNPKARKIVKNVLSNDLFYDNGGNLKIPEGNQLGDDAKNYLGKIYHKVQDDISIRKQESLYKKRDMSKGETIARSFFPDAYDRKGIVGKAAQGTVDLMESLPRLGVATKRALSGETSMAASLTAPSKLRTEAERTVAGVGASPAAKVSSKFGGKAFSKWVAGKTPEVVNKVIDYLNEATEGLQKAYKKGADAIDTPYSLASLEEIEKAAVTAKTSFANKAATNIVREGANEAITTGSYVASELSKEDVDLFTASMHLLGGGLSTIAPALTKSVGTGYGRLADDVVSGLKKEGLPLGFTEEYF